MDTTRFRIKKQINGTSLPTITRKIQRSYHGDYSYFDFFVDTWLGLIFMVPLLIWAWYSGYQEDSIKGLLFYVYLTSISAYIYYIFDEIDERIDELENG
tara:strand:+ start:237 stop:533 length:297 start_codon:yes stop_codon:yes gene_type:complete